MPLTQITADSIADSAITAQKLNPNVPLGGPKITAVQVTNSSYTALDDTAVALSGGFIRIVGSGFTSGASVIVGSAIAEMKEFGAMKDRERKKTFHQLARELFSHPAIVFD